VAQNINVETIRLKLQDFGKLKSVSGAFNKLNKSLAFTPKQINETIKSITKFDQRTKGANKTSVRSVATYNKQIAALRELQNNVAIGGKAYRAFGAEADRLRAQLEALTNTQKKQKGFFGKIGVGGRAALGAAAGSLTAGLGSTAQLAFTGGAVGGAAGAAIGAGLGAVVDTAKFSAESATYASEIQKLRIALKGVTKDQITYEKGLSVITETSKRLNVPIAASTKQFTTLSASVLGAGGSIEDAETVFVGVSEAIKATGGNAEDVQSAIRAMSQIFGKGKVSAEELQGQLGERLAGAVVKFAEANNSSLAQLQKDLRDGTVGLDKVIAFAKKLNVDFGKTAEQVANSSADAGQRLKVQMDNLKLAVGEAVLPLGAAFQTTFGEMAQAVLDSQGAMKGITLTIKSLGAFALATVEAVRFLTRALVDQVKIMNAIKRFDFKEAIAIGDKGLGDTAQQFKKNLETFKKIFGIGQDSAEGDTSGTTSGTSGGLPPLQDLTKSPLKSFAESAFKFAEQAENAVVNAFKGMEDAMVKFVMTGKLNFKDLANSIISDLTRMLIRAAITKPLFGFLFPGLKDGGVVNGGEIVKSAKGNVFAGNKIIPYAMGGIVNKPTVFPMANGMGLMGEAGPEAVMPLKRGSNGKLGVQSSGGVGNIVVNVDASGSSVEGNSAQSQEFGRALASAIQSELLKQKRPGGLLT
tara:strand:+ start:10080 stop:12167 length:2088 start_codon:yes stop_codon:yes gene_type:complete